MNRTEALDIIKAAHSANEIPNLCRANLSGVDLNRANLGTADLRWANMRVADLRLANLSNTNLHSADLRGACLYRASLYNANCFQTDFRGGDLRSTDLSWTNLRRAIGCHVLTHTQHGYTIIAIWHDTEWRIQGGCRDFSIAEARAHWGSEDYPYPPDGERICLMLDWLEQQPTPEQQEN